MYNKLLKNNGILGKNQTYQERENEEKYIYNTCGIDWCNRSKI